MQFSELDAVEQDMSTAVEHMTADQLVCYIKESMHAIDNTTMAVMGFPPKERSVMQGMQRTYGQADAGLIVKWVMWKYRGRNNKGEPIRFFDFVKGRKWWTDKLHLEMQAHRRKETPTAPGTATATTLKDI